MMDNRMLFTGRDQLELKLYKMLGIRYFQRLVLALEVWKNRKQGTRFRNYHLGELSGRGLAGHYIFLSYNAGLHLLCILFLVAVEIAARILGRSEPAFTFAAVILVILNAYCILLQRYNALRLKKAQAAYQKRYDRRVKKNALLLSRALPQGYEKERISRDLTWLKDLGEKVTLKKDHVISSDETAIMNRLGFWSKSAGLTYLNSGRHKFRDLKDGFYIYERVERRAALLQGFLGNKQHLLKPCAIITREREAEWAFAKLFPDDSPQGIREVLDTFSEFGSSYV